MKSNVYLNDGFSAKGEVRFLGADIGGQLDCAGGIFDNQGDYALNGWKKYALNADRVKTGGHVFLNKYEAGGGNPFTAHGRVRFANADIGGNFNCKGGQFLHSGKRSAVAAGGLKSRGAVFLSDDFTVQGDVDLHVAQIGNFVCKECSDDSKGIINLSSTKAVAVDDDKNSWRLFKFLLDDFIYGAFFGENTPKDKSRLKWLDRRPETRRIKGQDVEVLFSPLPYEQAAKVLFGMGHARDAREILLKKERLQTKEEEMHWLRKVGRRLWDVFAGYGYRLRYTMAWMLGIVVFGAAFFGVAAHHNQIVPHQPAILASTEYQATLALKEHSPMEAARAAFPVEYPEFTPLAFSLDVFIPLFALHQEPFWAPASNKDDDWWKSSILLVLFLAALGAFAWLVLRFQNWISHAQSGVSGPTGAGIGMAFLVLLLGLDFVAGFALVFLDFEIGLWLADWRWLTVWYWLEIIAGWILTSLFLLSITGLLRPRQSSGERD